MAFARLLRRAIAPAVLIGLVLAMVPDGLSAGETAETVLIRQALEKDRSGRRRGDVELIISAYDEDRFVAYDGNGVIDPLGWTVRHEDLEHCEAALEEDLRTKRYDIQRIVTFIDVWKDKAFATTFDSGLVVDRSTGTSLPHEEINLWTFRKEDDKWFVTAVLSNIADSTAGRYKGESTAIDGDLADFLADEAQDWRDGDAAGVAGHFDDEFIGYDAFHEVSPAKWWIVFGDADEFEGWLDERFALVEYDVQREVLHTSLGPAGQEAVAVTRDRVTARHAKGDAVHSDERLVVWTLSKRGGSWRVTNMLSKIRRPAAGT